MDKRGLTVDQLWNISVKVLVCLDAREDVMLNIYSSAIKWGFCCEGPVLTIIRDFFTLKIGAILHLEILFNLVLPHHDFKVLTGMPRRQQLAAYKEKRLTTDKRLCEQKGGERRRQKTRIMAGAEGESTSEGMQGWQAEAKGDTFRGKGQRRQGRRQRSSKWDAEDDAVGGTKPQLHCARWHLFRKENSSTNNKRHAQMAYSFPYVLLLRYLSEALAPKSLMV